MARCRICGAPDAGCGAAPLEKPVLGEISHRRVDAKGDVVDENPSPQPGSDAEPVGDVQGDD